MLATYGSLSGVAGREVNELARLPGVGRAKAARLVAAFELTRRLRARTPGARTALSSPSEVYAAFGPLMEDLPREVFRVALLDAQNGLLRDVIVSEGRSEEHTSELQSLAYLVCRLLLEKKKKKTRSYIT